MNSFGKELDAIHARYAPVDQRVREILANIRRDCAELDPHRRNAGNEAQVEAFVAWLEDRCPGRTHEVTTAVALRELPEETITCERTVSSVTFAPMSAEEIDWYVATGEGMDKAGAYALQGIGALFIVSIAGSYTNVIGLPLESLYPHLRRHGLLPLPSRHP